MHAITIQGVPGIIGLKNRLECADNAPVTEEHRVPDEADARTEFSIVRKGFDPAEVEKHLAEYDDRFRDLEEYTSRLKRELKDARRQISRLKAAEQESIDTAMVAVFAAKDRIIEAATHRAREIEQQARIRAGLSSVEPISADDGDASEESVESQGEAAGVNAAAGSELLDQVSALVGDVSAATVHPDDVLQKMLEEAETIRNRLDTGLSAAFDQMEEMQRAAEERAEDLLVSARLEAERIRSAAASAPGLGIEVSLTDDPTGRPSRYSRNSAGLPRIGDNGDDSVLAKMSSLRTSSGDSDADADTDAAPTHDAAG